MSETNTIAENDLLEAIVSGRMDDRLDFLRGIIDERQRQVRANRARVTVLSTDVGTTGVLHGLSPKYINGVRVKVTAVKRTKLVVEPVEPEKLPYRTAKKLGAFRFGDGANFTCVGCTVPASCFEAD